ncbi:crotonase/enoyl-CoA hydratase family protein [Sphingomonas qomolangmaensis]|uniref:Crotonase/enoyl-CoA hydratase family protein n=1 Tax=Sphingomonas qomolangmaensis TaxID=2918765 RepID=A0ABY5L8M5_9SPHN|nr:crotonase/enoyl-CoA hydratase family protein [Sphingomonas qomolangmaensis]UUL82095.1 crotonase/enoyl-CoA hydratase family protein [Sphingomonas qomolangmaensis]
MSDQRVTTTIEAGIADVRLSRPEKMNALDPQMFAAIAGTILRLGETPGLRCIVLSGEGRAFCAGLDMASMASGGSGATLEGRTHGDANLYQHVAWGWRNLPVPVIAAVHGIAFGGGFQIMGGADIRICAPATRLSIMELKWGIVPDMAGFALWRTIVRDDVLRELAYTAREFDAAEALAHGFVTRLADDPHAAAMDLAQQIAGRHPQAVRAAKRLANLAADADSAAILQAESDEQARLMRTPNQLEAVRANIERRSPVFAD